jgi:thiol-disulfide isomerase/thioredoxin
LKAHRLFLVLIALLAASLCAMTVVAENQVVVDFYYSSSCGSCKVARQTFEQVMAHYEANDSEKVLFFEKEVGSNATNKKEMLARGVSFPSVVIDNQTKIPKANITYDFLVTEIDAYVKNLSTHESPNPNILYLPIFGKVNLSEFSLPVFTVVLAGLDSFNPCSFFILIFLLNLLLYLRSRRRMLLVGCIFIFFSGFFYYLFMFALFNSLLLTASYIGIISLVAGAIALFIGILNIKDFFFTKQGPTLSIPEEQRSKTFKRIRQLVKSPSLLFMLGGTVVLAVTVNFYELLCTLGFPLLYTSRLTELHLPLFDYYLYLFFYNVVYVIPLIVILLLFTFTLGRTKLSEWQGQQLKLVSGLMIFSFGLCFLFDYSLLEDVRTPIALLGASILLTLLISFFWKKRQKPLKEPHPEEQPSLEEEDTTQKPTQ